MKRFVLFLTALGVMCWHSVFAQCFINVSNVNNDGPGSLRQAIIDANACYDQPIISFSINTADTIVLTSDLPPLNHGGLIIDATTAVGYSYPNEMVSINWAGRIDCFKQYKSNVIIRGLAFTNDNNGNGNASIHSLGGSELRVEYCKAFNQNRRFVRSNGGSDITVLNCTVHDFSNDGDANVFQVNDGGFSLIRLCVITNIPRKVFEINSSTASVTIIRENVLTNIGYEDNSSAGGKGSNAISLSNDGTRLLIRNNIVNGCKSKFVSITRGTAYVVKQDSIFNNTVLNCTGQHVIYISGEASSHPYIGFNYFKGDGGAYSMDQVLELRYVQQGVIEGNVIKDSKARGLMSRNGDGMIIRNNIMYNLSQSNAIELNDDCDNVSIQGNIFGTDSLNNVGLSVFSGSAIQFNDCDNCSIGGDLVAGEGNQIIASQGNRAIGVSGSCEGTTTIQGNKINVSSNGLSLLSSSNAEAVRIEGSTAVIGGDDGIHQNIIAGLATGIEISSPNATIEGNLFGCSVYGSHITGSSLNKGIYADAGNLTIGSKTDQGRRNKFGYCNEAVTNNNRNNILWSGNEYWNNTGNYVLNNAGSNPNGSIQPPVITGANISGTVSGTALANARVEIYHWNPALSPQGYEYLGHTNANGSGSWSFNHGQPFANEIAALQINGQQASEFTSYDGLGITVPDANSDNISGLTVGSVMVYNILQNDYLANGNPASAGSVTIDIDPDIPGTQAGLSVAGEGSWTYYPGNGNLSFVPLAGFTTDPTIIQYILTENSTGYFDAAAVVADYNEQTPDAINDQSLNNTAGSNVSLNIISNDLLSDGSPATPSLISVDIDIQVLGIQSSLKVPKEGVWTYNEQTGIITFDPFYGVTLNPTPVTYRLLEDMTSLSDYAEVSVTYVIPPPTANNDGSSGHYFGSSAAVNILDNDILADGSTALPGLVSIDLDPSTAGNQYFLEVPGAGLWSYNSYYGQLVFIPEIGYYGSQQSVAYTLIENGTGLSDDANVTVNYAAGNNILPPSNLQAGTYNYNNVLLSWEAPLSGGGEVLNWDGGINYEGIGLTAGGTFSVAARWTPDQLSAYGGLNLTSVNFFPRGNEDYDITLQVWSGANASTLIVAQPVSNFAPDQWNTIMLNNPVPINTTEELWVGYTISNQPVGAYPAGCDDGPAINGYGDKISFDGSTWEDLKGLGYNYNWNIQAVLEPTDAPAVAVNSANLNLLTFENSSDEISRSNIQVQNNEAMLLSPIITGYRVFRDGIYLETVPSSSTTYYDLQLPDDDYSYYVTTVYDLGVSFPSDTAQVTVPGGVGPVIGVTPSMIEEVHPDPPQVTTTSMTVANTGTAVLQFDIDIMSALVKSPSGILIPGDINTTQREGDYPVSHKSWNAVKLDPPVTSNLNSRDEAVIRYDDGTNYGAIGLDGPGVFEAAAYFPSSTMANYEGMLLTDVEVYLFHAPHGFKVKIYGQGTSSEPGDIIYEQEVSTTPLSAQWSVINLGPGVPISGEDMWISYEVTQNDGSIFPAGFDAGPAVVGFGDMNYLNGEWTSMSVYGFNFNWNIAGLLKDQSGNLSWLSAIPMEGTVGPNENISIELTFNSENLSNGIYEALMNFNSNDSLNPVLQVPVELNVGAVILNPPIGLQGLVDENDVILSWSVPVPVPGEELEGYKVYKDGNPITQLADTTFTDENLISGTYTYYVTALYNFGESDPSNTIESTIQPSSSDPTIVTDPTALDEWHFYAPEITIRKLVISNTGEIPLEYTVEVAIDPTKSKNGDSQKQIDGKGSIRISNTKRTDPNDVAIGSLSDRTYQTSVIRHDDGVNYNAIGLIGDGMIGAAAYFPDTMMVPYSGQYLDKIEFYIKDLPYLCMVKVFGPGTPSNPGDLIHQQVVEVNSNQWNLIPLSLPVLLDGNDLWICYEAYHYGGKTPSGVDDGPALPGFGDWITVNGTSWTNISLIGINSNWNLAGHITETPSVEWLSAQNLSGTVGQGETDTVLVIFNSWGLDPGTYHGEVILNSNDPSNSSLSVPVTLTIDTSGLLPPENLTGSVVDDKIYLDWELPASYTTGEWMQWDEGVNYGYGIGLAGGGSFYIASHWLPSDLVQYDGQFLTSVSFFPVADPFATYELYVWSGPDASNLMFAQTVYAFMINAWNKVDLETPVPIDADQEFWFGYKLTHEAGTYPAGTDNGPAVLGKGDMISLDGYYWTSMGASYGYDINWNLAGFVSPESKGKSTAVIMSKTPVLDNTQADVVLSHDEDYTPGSSSRFRPERTMFNLIGYNIYRNMSLVGYVDSAITDYVDTVQWAGYYEYYVTSLYEEGESAPSNIWSDVIVYVSEVSHISVKVYPNPARDHIVVKAGELMRSIQLFNSFGQIVRNEKLGTKEHHMNVSDLKAGLYVMVIRTDSGPVSARVLII